MGKTYKYSATIKRFNGQILKERGFDVKADVMKWARLEIIADYLNQGREGDEYTLEFSGKQKAIVTFECRQLKAFIKKKR